MYCDNFKQLWKKTVNGVLYGISASQIKSKTEINRHLKQIVWKSQWGNKSLVPPERKFLDELYKEFPQKAKQIEIIISNVKCKNNVAELVCLACGVIGLVMALIFKHFIGILCAAIGIIGLVSFVFMATECRRNPMEYTKKILKDVENQCVNVLKNI